MAVSPNGRFLTYQYEDDEGNQTNITLSQGVAAAGGFAIGDPDSENFGHRGGRNKVRHVTGVTADGAHRAILPCPTVDAMISKYNGGTFTISGTTYVITGRVGERITRSRFS